MIFRRLLSPAADAGNTSEKFEDLLARLEQIVSDMENAELPLEDRLVDAEQKVEILSRALSADPAKAAATPEETPPPASKDDIRLF